MSIIPKKTPSILLLFIFIELFYFSLCLLNIFPLLRVILILPSLFIIPGFALLFVLKRAVSDILQLIVEGFFVSILLCVFLTSFLFALGFSLTSFVHSFIALLITIMSSLIALKLKLSLVVTKSEFLIFLLVFFVYAGLVIYFNTIPRFFTPDETSYIFSARMGVFGDSIYPTGVTPNTNMITVFMNGRLFWIYLLSSFIASTCILSSQAGLIGASFLVMTGLLSSLLAKKIRIRVAIFIIVTFNPLLIVFSGLALNDLALCFFIFFSLFFFAKSFSKIGNKLLIDFKNLTYSFLAFFLSAIIKPNFLFFVVMLLILIFYTFRYKLYKRDWKYKASIFFTVMPVLLYEICIDIPYFVSVWLLRNAHLANLFKPFLIVSPFEYIVSWFSAPWWNPLSSTIFTKTFNAYVDYFYALLSPESYGLILAATVLALPIIFLFNNQRKQLDKTLLLTIVFISFWLFFFGALSSSTLNDINRYSLWMIPIWIPLSIIILKSIVYSHHTFKKSFLVVITALIIIYLNILISNLNGGIVLGYGVPRLFNTTHLIVQLLFFVGILFVLLKENVNRLKLSIGKKTRLVCVLNLKKMVFTLILILILLNGLFYSSYFITNSSRYNDTGLAEVNNQLAILSSDKHLIFANNYIQMRTHVNNDVFQNGLLVPPPETKEEFFKLIELAPKNTLFLISNDASSTNYEYANKYIKDYTYTDFITLPKSNNTEKQIFNLSDPILKMTFDDSSGPLIFDKSGYENNGYTFGAIPIESPYGKSIAFNGKQYVSINSTEKLTFHDTMSISILTKIDEAEANKGYMIISKGYASINGSFHVFIWNKDIYFSVGWYGDLNRYVSFPISNLLGTWHSFVFTYDSKALSIYLDGELVASKSARGPINPSLFDIELGRDSERLSYFFKGAINEIQISNKTINSQQLLLDYSSAYLQKIREIPSSSAVISIFESRKSDSENPQRNITVKNVSNSVEKDLTVILNLHIVADSPGNVTILVITDRFTKVNCIHLDEGINNVIFKYPYRENISNEKSPLWNSLAKSRLVVMDSENIIYNKIVTNLNLEFCNMLLLLYILIIILVFCLVCLALRKRTI